MTGNKKTDKNISSRQFLKQELLNNLDDFLVDANVSQPDRHEEKQKALEELDKLIKQDLSYNQILTTIKKSSQENIKQRVEQEEEPVIKDEQKEQTVEEKNVKPIRRSQISGSPHVVDLSKDKIATKSNRPSAHKLSQTLSKKIHKSLATKPKIEKKESTKEHKLNKVKPARNFKMPAFSWPSIGFTGALPKAMIFALVLMMLLLPLRALVLVGKIQDDKNAIINFGKEGLFNLQTGVISASSNSYEDAQDDFTKSLENFHQAQAVLDQYHTWIINTSSLLPVVGRPISLSKNLIAIATNISEAATVLNQKLKVQDNPTEYLAIITKQINDTLPYLRSAERDLKNISTGLLPENLQPYFDSLKDYLPETIGSLENLNNVFSLAQELLGHDTEKRYLVLFQNNNEIRATGGFIGSFAIFDVYQGKVVNLEVPKGGTYDLDAGQTTKYKAPQALSLVSPYFNIWDANWWYDFPRSAAKITQLYQESGQSSVNGVIAINAEVLKNLLAVLGPITLEEYNITIDQENIFDVLQAEVELNYDKEDNKPKAVIADLVPIVMEKLLTNSDKYKDIVTVFAETLKTKDIQIYSNEPELQNKILDFGWGGQMINTDRDYLAVINTTIGGGKFDRNIYQTIDHQAEISTSGEIINTVRITRTNQDGQDNPFVGIDGGSASYMRIYVPYGSEFIEAIGFDGQPVGYMQDDPRAIDDADIAKEGDKMIDSASGVEIYNSMDKTVFANWMILQPGEQKTVLIKYKLPFKLDFGNQLVNDWWRKVFKKDLRLDNYSLVVQSQAGSNNDIINSSVLLPSNVKVVWNNATDETSMNITDDLITYHTELNDDQYFGFIVATK